MESSEIRTRAGEFTHALHALEKGTVEDAERIASLFAENAVLRNSALDNKGKNMEGREEILSFWREYKATLGDVFSEFHQITMSENSAGLFWTTQGKNPSGEEVHYHGATLLEFNEEGCIQSFRGYYDTRELMVKA